MEPTMDRPRRKMLAKFLTTLAIKKAQIASNPFPYLKKADRELGDSIRCMDNVIHALTGTDSIMDFAQSHNLKPEEIEGQALIRINAALEIIKEYENVRLDNSEK